MKRLLIYYNFVLVLTMSVIGFVGATSYPQLLSALFFFPLAFFFTLLILPKKRHAIDLPTVPDPLPKKTKDGKIAKAKVEKLSRDDKKLKKQGVDIDRRTFVKLIGSAGITVFLFAMFTKRAQGAFFGSNPGPGIVALKDTSGAQIDPAQHHPTDGYRLAELDDSTPAYYGFTRADAYWFIIKEGSGGDFRYVAGSTDFATSWTGRAALSYGYYDSAF